MAIAGMPLEAPGTALEGFPRIGVVPSATSNVYAALSASEKIGLELFPWQRYALDVIYSADEQNAWKYREIAIVASRQNGKSEILVPLILEGLERGERILHTAQDRQLPREVFDKVANHAAGKIRRANGQESITHPSGGRYMILAPQKSFRGRSADRLIIDEVREQKTFDLIQRAEPTVSASANPQVIYLSNAGDDESIVLNELQHRGTSDDPGDLAYLEWSADPLRPVDDENGWREANPSMGYPGGQTMRGMRALFRKYQAANELSIFETEHLCRWVVSMAPAAVSDAAWQSARGVTEEPVRPFMGISVSSDGRRASVAYAWRQTDGTLGLIVRDFSGQPINAKSLAIDLEQQAKADRVQLVGFDPWTDQDLARYFPKAKAINGQEYANASERFVRAIETGELRWQHAEPVSADRPFTARKHTGSAAWIIEQARSERSITGFLAAIRAVWLASAPPAVATIY